MADEQCCPHGSTDKLVHEEGFLCVYCKWEKLNTTIAEQTAEIERLKGEVPRYLLLAMASATRALRERDLARLSTINENIQGLVDEALSWVIAESQRADVAEEERDGLKHASDTRITELEQRLAELLAKPALLLENRGKVVAIFPDDLKRLIEREMKEASDLLAQNGAPPTRRSQLKDQVESSLSIRRIIARAFSEVEQERDDLRVELQRYEERPPSFSEVDNERGRAKVAESERDELRERLRKTAVFISNLPCHCAAADEYGCTRCAALEHAEVGLAP